MASVVQICNMALSHLGAEAQVASIAPPDGSVEAGLCATFYPIARQEMLELGTWSWANKRKLLAVASTNPSTVWAYAYARPSDCLSVLRVLPLSKIDVLRWPDENPDFLPLRAGASERDGVEFEQEGDLILTNEPDAVLMYRTDVTDTTRFSATSASALSMLLASYLAGPIIKGLDGAKIGASWRQSAIAAINAASALDANEAQESTEFIPEKIKARA